MRIARNIILTFFCCLMVLSATMAQSGNNAVASCFLQNNEKVFVQLDRHILISGEELNYNCFVVNASTHKPDSKSRIVYFELSDAANRSVFSWRSNISGSVVSGSVVLPDTLETGAYTLKAYTNWMRNFSPAFYYSTTLLIGRVSDEEYSTYKVAVPTSSVVSAFPEGGKLFYGSASNIGVCVKPSQKSKIEILNTAKEVVAEVVTSNQGRGLVPFTPQAGQTYSVKASDLLGKVLGEQPLVVEFYGYAMLASVNSSAITVRVSASSPVQSDNLKMFVHQRGQLVLSKNVSVNNGVGSCTINVDSVLSGIIDLTLVDKMNNVIAERLVPVMQKNAEPLLALSNSELESNHVVDFSVQAPASIAQNSNVAVSISLKEPELAVNSSLSSYLLFASELADSQIESDCCDLQQLDLMLLTTSLSDYLWNEKRFDTIRTCKYVVEHKGYVMEGKVLSPSTGLPLANELVVLSLADSIPLIKICTTDANGRFFFRLNTSFDNRKVFLQLHDSNASKQATWVIDSKTTPQSATSVAVKNFNEDTKRFLKSCRDLQVVRAVYKSDLVSIPKAGVNGSIASNFTLFPNSIVYPADYSELKDFGEIASNILPTVSFRKVNDKYELRVYDMFNKIAYNKNAGLLLNGIPFYDLTYLSTLGTNEIKKIEVYNSHVLFGDYSFYGLVSIYTNDKKMSKSFIENKNFYFMLNKVATDVPSAMYMADNDLDSKLPYFNRSLLVKNKMLDGDKASNFTFNTSLYKGSYNVLIQGIAKNGQLFEKRSVIDVK